MLNDIEKYLHHSSEEAIDLHPDYTVHVKRDDLIHNEISGNKWRKLKYNLLKAQETGCDTLITFGGAFSNHIAATAKAAQLCGFKSVGIIRGEHIDKLNSTLSFASACGMHLIPVPVSEYEERNNYNYHDQLKLEYPLAHIVPEGGANFEGVSGAQEIVAELNEEYDFICCAVGTGTTAAGFILSKPKKTKILCFNNFKNSAGVREMISQKINLVLNHSESVHEYQNDFEIIDGYSFGGYSKVDDTLKNFAREIYAHHKLPLDLVYTAKALYGLNKMLENSASLPLGQEIKKGSKILFYHSGGLQGNKGFGFVL
jgi:1-aminocyclopropane-1-carboxylate deaminase